VKEQPMYHNCASLCSLCKEKEGTKIIYISLVSLITGIKANMLLIIFLGLIAKLELGSGKCEHGNLKVKDFDWSKVGIVYDIISITSSC
jgi:hypothetical protein